MLFGMVRVSSGAAGDARTILGTRRTKTVMIASRGGDLAKLAKRVSFFREERERSCRPF